MNNSSIRLILTELIAEHLSSLNKLNALLKNLEQETKPEASSVPEVKPEGADSFMSPGKTNISVGKTYSISEAADIIGVPRKVLTAYLVSRQHYYYDKGLRRNLPKHALQNSPLMYDHEQLDARGNSHSWWKFTSHGLSWLNTEVSKNPTIFGKYTRPSASQPALI